MHPDLEHLATAATHDRALRANATALRKLNEDRAAVEAGATHADADAQRLVDALAANKAAQRELQREVERYEARRASALRVLEHGNGDAEAAERQVASVSEILDQLETRLLEHMEEQESTEQALAAGRAAAQEARARLAAFIDAEPALRQALDAERARLEPLRDAALEPLDRTIRQKYVELRDRKGHAVAAIRRDVCDACNVFVQPQQVADLKRGLILPCRGCGRWLIPPEG